MSVTPTLPLLHGAQIPVIGLGTWPLRGAESAAPVRTAIEAGYRLIDTAENYHNEDGVGQGIRDSGVDRAEIFITTKLNRRWHSVDGVRQAFEASLQRLGVDYLDLLLIHWPNPDLDRYVDALRGLGRSAGRPGGCARSAPPTSSRPICSGSSTRPGSSPTSTRSSSARTPPAMRPGPTTPSTASSPSPSPIGASESGLREDPVIARIAEQHGKSVTQVVLRWHVQLGLVAIPKSANPGRIAENIDIFDFELSEDELASISGLDRGEAEVTDSDVFGHWISPHFVTPIRSFEGDTPVKAEMRGRK